MTKKSFAQIFADARKRDSFWVEGAIIEFTADLERLMKRQGITNTELAERIGTSTAYITKVFRGNANFTLQTMVKLSRALDGNLHVHVVEKDARVRWIDVHHGKMTTIKKDVEMVEVGGPSTESGNWGEYAQNILKKYKVEKHAEA